MSGAPEAAAATTQAVTETVTETVAATTEAATAAAETAAETATEAASDLATLFTAEGFDFDRAVAAVEASNLSTLAKGVATRALQGARDNPALLDGALTQVRALLGL